MKEILSYAIGAALFLAGYYHTRRHIEYAATKATPASPNYATTPEPLSPDTKPAFAFRIKPS